MEKDNKRKCGVCEIPHFERNNYFYGKLMTARDFTDEQCYFNEKRWLINRMIHGWGVVCGLDVKFEDGKEDCIQEISSCQKEKQCNIIIDRGLAIDCCGREIVVCDKQTISLADVEPPCNPAAERPRQGRQRFVICLEYNECKTEPVTVAPSMCSQSEKSNYNRIRDSFRIRLRYASDVSIPDRKRKYCQLADRKNEMKGGSDVKHYGKHQHDCEQYEPLHHYLCKKLSAGCPECDPCGCLVLAEVTAEPISGSDYEQHKDPKQQERQDKTRHRKIKLNIDPCSHRRLVYNNKMLYDLIHCHHDDLPHIIEISWLDFHGKKRVYWDDFVRQIIKKGLTVTFDHAIDPKTVNRHTFLISFKFADRPSGTIVRKFIPVEDITVMENQCKYMLRVDREWIDEEIDASKSELFDGIDVDITLRSSLICDLDCKALDGDFICGKLPTGNGVQGGDFLSWFTVRPKNEKRREKQIEEPEDIFESAG